MDLGGTWARGHWDKGCLRVSSMEYRVSGEIHHELTRWLVGQGDIGSKGDRRPDDWQVCHFQVSGLGHQVSGSGAQVQVRVQEICHPSSAIDPVIQFGWRVAAPGGRWRGFSIQPSIQPSTQSSIQSSVIPSAQPEAARSARSADPTSRQCPEITKNDELRTKNSLEQPYVVTRSLPLALPLWACK